MRIAKDFKTYINRVLHKFGLEIVKVENTTDFRSFAKSSNLASVSGILHIGAHFGEERYIYDALQKPVLWIEAVPQYFEQLQENISEFKLQKAKQMLLADEERDFEFFLTNNEGASSSIYQLAAVNGFEDSGLKVDNSIILTSKRLDEQFSKEALSKFDHWVIDVQGAELDVLKGAGDLLSVCNSIDVEVSRREIYVGAAIYSEIVDYLTSRGFVQIWEARSGEHMDVLFIKRNGSDFF